MAMMTIQMVLLFHLSPLLMLLAGAQLTDFPGACNASCLGADEIWPPQGFTEDETAVRCSLRCMEVSKPLISC